MNRRYQMTTPFVPKNINQSVAVMDKLILMIAMLKIWVSQNGPRVNVAKYQNINKFHICWDFYLWHNGTFGCYCSMLFALYVDTDTDL